MGFFSFLYWLIGHPDRFIHIYSIQHESEWQLELREYDGMLTGEFVQPSFDRYPLLKDGHGTIVMLFAPDGELPKDQFQEHIQRLQFIQDVSIQMGPIYMDRMTKIYSWYR